MNRAVSILACTAAAALFLGGLGAAPAFAADSTPTTLDELLVATTTGCVDGDVVTLGATMEALGGSLPIWCDLTLNLNGFTLTSAIELGAVELVIDDTGGGVLVAENGGAYHAGIQVNSGARLIVRGGTITAEGEGAGIGGGTTAPGSDGSTGDIFIEGGDVTASSTYLGAGIGSGSEGSLDGEIRISGGTVHAQGGGGAGIGSGVTNDLGGVVNITGGDVTAIGGSAGAGIGGGTLGGAGREVNISGGTVTAIGGATAAGIGGGGNGSAPDAHHGDGGTLTITGGTVVASGGASAIGGGLGEGGLTGDFGHLSISGTAAVPGVLSVPSGPFVISDSDAAGAEVEIGEHGLLMGDATLPTTGASITGLGQIDNHGVIALAGALVQVLVNDRDFDVAFDPQTGDPVTSVRLFAPDFASGYRDIPAPPAGTAWSRTADDSGELFTDTTPVTGDLTLYAVDTSFRELAAALANCTDGDTVVVTEDLAGGPLVIGCDVTLDLAGHLLAPAYVDVLGGAHLIVDDTTGGGELRAMHPTFPLDAGIHVPPTGALTVRAGTVTAEGGGGAAIGGAWGNSVGEAAGTITIEGGHVSATARYGGAGIGGGVSSFGGGAGGDVTITGGDVIATSLFGGSGIGGGSGWASGGGVFPGGPGGTVTITGGTVEASGVATGIGGGIDADGGTVAITGAVVTASAGYGSAVGGGGPAAAFGSLTLAGTLHVHSGVLRVPDSDPAAAEITIESSGLLTGADATPTAGAEIVGDGQIDNHGVIALEGALVANSITVNDHDYLVGFDAQDGGPVASVRLFAPDFQTGFRTIPALDAPDDWNTADDGSGDWFDADSLVSADVTLYAVTDATLTLVASSDSVAQGGSISFVVTGEDHDGDPVDTSGAVLSSSVATDVVDGLTVTFPHASPHVITATLGDATATVTIEVVAAPAPSSSIASSGAGLTAPLGLLAAALLAAGAGALAMRLRGRRGIRATIRRR